MTLNLIAVDSYGSHRVNDPLSKKRISAYKIGYSGATSRVLLTLFKDKARDVSSKRASYHYIHIDKSVQVKQGYILLRLTDIELKTVETLTRSHIHSHVYRWRDGQWWVFPNNREADYHKPAGSYPRFEGTGIGGTQPLAEEDKSSVGVIVVERSQHDPDKSAWFWLSGNTYPHRTFLKSMGCRWSKKRKSWYFIGDKLPDEIQLLVDKLNGQRETDDDPCTVEEAEAVLGVLIDKKPEEKSIPPRLFADGESVYARQQLETSDKQVIPTGTKGKITRLFNHNAKWGYSYDVTFANFGTHWFFENELTTIQPTTGISITHETIVPAGVTPPATNAEMRQAALANGHQPESIATEDETEEMPAIRIIPAPTIPENGELDDIQEAIRSTKIEPRTITPQSNISRKTLATIGQQYVGNLTGAITGNVMCFGYAIHDGTLIYLNLGGPRMAVEAIRARLLKR
ncbi:MAG: hypothetical protein Q9P44_15980 [Anaerolineae bacterium]|nr:hypothetical protein [Anaerolineae bacterium]